MTPSTRASKSTLPTGLVTFLFTDIEGSTELAQEVGDEVYLETIERHNEILGNRLNNRGRVVHITGDSFFAVFLDPLEAVLAAAEVQKDLKAEIWRGPVQLSVRMGLHTGEARLGGGDYVGLDVHRAARVSSAAHGGQILLSGETARRVVELLPAGIDVREMGRHRLKDLSQPEELYQLVIDGLPRDFPPVVSVAPHFGNLPSLETSFIGRTEQIDHVVDLVTAHRLVTLTGPGGTGKTRLAIEVAWRLTDHVQDGVYFVDLAEVDTEDMIPRTILASLSHPVISGDPQAELTKYLGDREVLLVLDNYEQVLPSASVVAGLLDSAPRLRLLITSRAPLHLSLEHEYPVPPMPLPENGQGAADLSTYEAAELFVERATATNPSFVLDESNAEAVGKLIRRLDGLPLAIELAASRIRLLSPAEILERLSNRLLERPSPDVPVRQQTITGTIAWSFDLLDGPVRQFMARFSVFRGGAGLNEIEWVCNPGGNPSIDALDGLSRLVDQSLIEAKSTAGGTRYQMLVVVREFAAVRLKEGGEESAIRDAHLAAYQDLAARAEPLLLTSHQSKWLDILTVEHDNLRAAHDWALASGATDAAHELVANLWRFWQRRGHLHEAERRVEQTLETRASSPIFTARALDALGGVRYWRGDWQGAKDPYVESLEIMRVHGQPRDVAHALYNAAFSINFSGDPELATQYIEDSLAIFQDTGDDLGVGRAYWALCDFAFLGGDPEGCIALARKAESIFEGLDAPFDLGWARFMIGHASYVLKDRGTAREAFDAALPLFIDAGDISAFVLVVYAKAGILDIEGDSVTAARLLGALEVLVDQSGAGIGEQEANRYGSLLKLRESTDPEIREALESGKTLSTEELVELAIST